jgi:DNA-directed RNA polymerase specialized sigma24 family protein
VTRWQDEVTSDEWQQWQSIARQASIRRGQITSLGPEDYAAHSIEKLLSQEVRPANVEAWIRLTIKNAYIDRWRRITARGVSTYVDVDDREFEHELKSALLGPKSAYMVQESVNEILGALSEKHQRLVLLYAAGFDTDEIAAELGYGSHQAVSNQLRRIQEALSERFESPLR